RLLRVRGLRGVYVWIAAAVRRVEQPRAQERGLDAAPPVRRQRRRTRELRAAVGDAHRAPACAARRAEMRPAQPPAPAQPRRARYSAMLGVALDEAKTSISVSRSNDS